MELIASSTLTGFASSLGANVSSAVDSVWPIVLVVGGILVGFAVIRFLISLVRLGGRSRF